MTALSPSAWISIPAQPSRFTFIEHLSSATGPLLLMIYKNIGF
jgi:hypothetical protein